MGVLFHRHYKFSRCHEKTSKVIIVRSLGILQRILTEPSLKHIQMMVVKVDSKIVSMEKYTHYRPPIVTVTSSNQTSDVITWTSDQS